MIGQGHEWFDQNSVKVSLDTCAVQWEVLVVERGIHLVQFKTEYLIAEWSAIQRGTSVKLSCFSYFSYFSLFSELLFPINGCRTTDQVT